jgi:hypothetical protein
MSAAPIDRDESERMDLREHRRRNFKAEVTLQRSPNFAGEFSLSITHNGYQWQSIGLMPEEAEQVIAALRSFIDSAKT